MSKKYPFSAVLEFFASTAGLPPPKTPPPARTETELAKFYRVKSLEIERAARAVGNTTFKSLDTLAAELDAGIASLVRSVVKREPAEKAAPAYLDAKATAENEIWLSRNKIAREANRCVSKRRLPAAPPAKSAWVLAKLNKSDAERFEREIEKIYAGLRAMRARSATKPLAPLPIDPAVINYDDMDTKTQMAALGGLLSDDPERGIIILRNEHARLIAKAAAEKAKMVAILEAMPLPKSKLELN